MTMDELKEEVERLAKETKTAPDKDQQRASVVLHALAAALKAPRFEIQILMDAAANYCEGLVKRATAGRN